MCIPGIRIDWGTTMEKRKRSKDPIICGPQIYLVGGLEHVFIFPFHIWDNPSQLTFLFFKMVETTNQGNLRKIFWKLM
jgi:hypothetical protein